jgi:lactoylglutathione lyase
MKIEHVAIWVKDLEKMKSFYETYFKGKAGNLYHNPAKRFFSYFITFEGGARLELMYNSDIDATIQDKPYPFVGYAHLAISTGSKEEVNNLTTLLQSQGYPVMNGPRTTGDGYYESVILDPEGNLIEITI